MKQKSRFGTKEKVVAIMLAVVLLVMVATGLLLSRSTRSYTKSEQEATALSKQYAKVTSVSDYYYFFRQDVYYATKGKNAAGQTLYTVIPKDGKEITVLNEKDGVSDNAAMRTALKEGTMTAITKVGLGKIDDAFVWEITGTDKAGALVYLTIGFKDGKVIKEINNI